MSARHTPSLGPPREAGIDRNEVWLWDGPMRCLYRSCRWGSHSFLCDPCLFCGWEEDHNHRRVSKTKEGKAIQEAWIADDVPNAAIVNQVKSWRQSPY